MNQDYIGEIVHYILLHGEHAGQVRPGIITEIYYDADGFPSGELDLAVVPRRSDGYMDSLYFAEKARYAESAGPNTWHWRPALS